MKYTIRELLDKCFNIEDVVKKFYKNFNENDILYLLKKIKELELYYMYIPQEQYSFLESIMMNSKSYHYFDTTILPLASLERNIQWEKEIDGIESASKTANKFRIEEGIGYWMHPSGEVDKIDEDTHYEWIVNNKSDLEIYINDDSEIYNDDYKFTEITDELSDINDRMLEDGWVKFRHIGNKWIVFYDNKDMELKINDFILEHIEKGEIVEYSMGENGPHRDREEKTYKQIIENGLFGSIK